MQSMQPDLYMNMQQFSNLKLQARQDSAQASRAVAQQFEGLFIQMMLKGMRSAAIMDKAQHSSYVDFYTDMYDKQISQTLSRQGGIGIAAMMQKQMSQYLPEGQTSAANRGSELPVYRLAEMKNESLPVSSMNYVAENPAVKTHQLLNIKESGSKIDSWPEISSSDVNNNTTTSLVSETVDPFYGWKQAESFVRDLWPHANKAASKLGISTRVLVAQSALETGWGKHAMKKADGSIAFNLFGIKAGRGWAGQSVSQNTLEYREGSMQQETANFRAYDSIADSLDDYVEFVTGKSRYASALDHRGNDLHYIAGLQQAGYATDPAYANKIERIMKSRTLQQALNMMTPHDVDNNRQLLS